MKFLSDGTDIKFIIRNIFNTNRTPANGAAPHNFSPTEAQCQDISRSFENLQQTQPRNPLNMNSKPLSKLTKTSSHSLFLQCNAF